MISRNLTLQSQSLIEAVKRYKTDKRWKNDVEVRRDIFMQLCEDEIKDSANPVDKFLTQNLLTTDNYYSDYE